MNYITSSNTQPECSRLVLLISGPGTNLQAILDAIAGGHLSARVVLVVSNRKTAYGLVRSKLAGVPTLYFPFEPYKAAGLDREQYDTDLAICISEYQLDLIVLAGWMYILSPRFLDCFSGRIINLHPALPGTFPGTMAISRAYKAYQQGKIRYSGCMVHYVEQEVDAGSVIVQDIVPIVPGDTLETFEARMHETEHQLIIKAIRVVL